MDQNQHNLVKMVRNFDAGPAAITRMHEDRFFYDFGVETACLGSVAGVILYRCIRLIQRAQYCGGPGQCIHFLHVYFRVFDFSVDGVARQNPRWKRT